MDASLRRANGPRKRVVEPTAARKSRRWVTQRLMVRGVVAITVLVVHLAVLTEPFSQTPIGVPGTRVGRSTSIAVVLLAPSEPAPLQMRPVLRRVTVRIPPPAAWQDLPDSKEVSGTPAVHSEPTSPPFERLIVEAKPQDAQGLHDFCTGSYPPEYRSLNEQGMVVLLVRIEADGHVSDMKVEQSSGSTRLDRVTQACVISGLFEPHRAGLRAVGSWQRIHWTWTPPS